MARDLVNPQNGEPAQVLLGMLAGSLLPEIVNVWIFMALLLAVFATTILILKRHKRI